MRIVTILVGLGVVLPLATSSYAESTPTPNSDTTATTAAAPVAATAVTSAPTVGQPTPAAATPPAPAAPAAAPPPATVSANVAPVMAAPTSPAFDAIGATPTTIAHPTSMRAMGATLLSYIDQSGHVNAGVALEAAPLWLLLGDGVTLRDWRGSYAQRAMSRVTVSFASAASASGVTSISEGLRFVLWDDSDPRWDMALESCLAPALKAALPKRVGGALPDDADTNPGSAPVVDDAAVKSCQDQAKARGNRDAYDASSGAFSSAVTEQQVLLVSRRSANSTVGSRLRRISAPAPVGCPCSARFDTSTTIQGTKSMLVSEFALEAPTLGFR